MKLLYLFFLFPLSFFTQEEITSFYFGEPQPKQISNTTHFDSTICGVYYLQNDSLTRLVITPDSIFTRHSVFFVLTKKEMRKSKGKYYLENDKLYGIVDNQGLTASVRNDTTYAIYNQEDLYFKPTPTNPLRKHGNAYFLSEKTENNYYEVYLIYPIKKGILIYSIDHEKAMPQIREITHLDSLQLNSFKTYIAYPSLKEMNLLIQNKGFKDVTLYYKPEYFTYE